MFRDPGRTFPSSLNSDGLVLFLFSSTTGTPAMRSFRDSLSRLPCSLCTLHAVITDDYATLAYDWWPTFVVPSFQTARLIQSVSLPLHLL